MKAIGKRPKPCFQTIADRHAGDIAQTVARQVERTTRQYLIKYSRLIPIVYTRVEASGILLTIRYLCEIRHRRLTEHEIWEDILHTFAQHPEVNFAYPTQRFYYNPVEGKRDGETDHSILAETGEPVPPLS